MMAVHVRFNTKEWRLVIRDWGLGEKVGMPIEDFGF